MSSNKIVETFAEKFNTTPRLFFSPGRINLIGEHIDYNDGFVMPAATDKGIWFAVAPNASDTANFYSADLNEAYSTPLTTITPVEGWQNYLLGVIDQVQKRELTIHGFDCVFGGNVPIGAGMSSSAAVECGLLFALNEIFELHLQRTTMATMAQKAEHTFPGVKVGIMDMFASLMGKQNNVILLDCMSLDYKYLPLDLEEYSLILINTKVHHSLASGEYNQRRQQCQEGFAKLQSLLPNIKSFRDIKAEDVEKHKTDLGEVVYKRCLYVTQEIERTQKAAVLLENNEQEAFGKLMFETHQGLSQLYEVSCKELDFLVEEAKKHSSIIGSRLMGGGFGGCTINLLHKKDWAEVAKKITDAYKKEFDIDAEVYEVATSDGTHEEIGG
ncbi:galactokinase [Segetibacter aerophilus]|uniref:Galactokinase n=1 Tax=Segetibacter aerophilus TaxID=670293 RepID=A0A512BCW9_9BACT|nr:galactokinase [Segetibacter aerophilus]GEO09735.1 galactokinase [Segetibacter aerophilus]